MKNLCSQLVKLESTSIVIEMAALVTLQATHAMVTTTSEVISSFTSCEKRYFINSWYFKIVANIVTIELILACQPFCIMPSMNILHYISSNALSDKISNQYIVKMAH